MFILLSASSILHPARRNAASACSRNPPAHAQIRLLQVMLVVLELLRFFIRNYEMHRTHKPGSYGNQKLKVGHEREGQAAEKNTLIHLRK
jgi:hypothetical protein